MSGAGPGGPARVAAVIDVGSNSVLLLTVALESDGRVRAVDEALATTRLGTGLRPGGTLDPAACARTREVVEEFAARARAAGAGQVWAFATGAVRDAAGGKRFAGELAAAAHIPVEVLAGEHEARLAYAASAGSTGAQLVVDVGGRTTELTAGRGADILQSVSLPLGALSLTETCLGEDPPTAAGGARLATVIAAALAGTGLPGSARASRAALTASGGTATALAALDLGIAVYDPRRVDGHVLGTAAVAATAERLLALPVAARGGLDAARAAILPAGALVLARVAEAAGATEIRVSGRGVRHGYLRERLAALGVAADVSRPWS